MNLYFLAAVAQHPDATHGTIWDLIRICLYVIGCLSLIMILTAFLDHWDRRK